MASYQDLRTAPKPDHRRVADKPTPKQAQPKRPAPQPKAKPIFTDWAMF